MERTTTENVTVTRGTLIYKGKDCIFRTDKI